MKNLLTILILSFISTTLFAQKNDSVHVYMKCRNDMSVGFFAKGYNPTKDAFSVKGARLVENKDNDRIAIVPDSAVVVFEIRKKGQPVQYFQMYSKEPPAPVFDVKMNGKKYFSFSETASGPTPMSIGINPVSDENFRMAVPSDAIYKIMEWDVSLNRANRPLKTITLKNNTTVPAAEFNAIRSAARSGDVIRIEVKKMMRRNAVGEMIPQKMYYPKLEYTIE